MTFKKLITVIILTFFTLGAFAADYYTATTTLNVRSGAGTKYPVMFTLKKGDQVKVHSKIKNWYEIEYKEKTGYASSKYLNPVSTKKTSNSRQEWGTLDSFLLIGGGSIAFLILLAFLLKGSALKNYGSTITLLATFLYYVFGLFANFMFITFSAASKEGIIVSFFTYFLALFVGILSIIGFFKNVGIGIVVLSTIIVYLDFSSGGLPGVILASMSIFGGILIAIGYSQIKTTR